MNEADYAIVIGISAYPQLTPLKGALQDANLFTNWLLSPEGGGLTEANVRLIISPDVTILDPFDAAPIKRDIDRAFRDFGLGNIDLDDLPTDPIGRRLYFYFSGHGVGPNFDEVAMLMADAGPNLLNNNVGMRPYRSWLHKVALFREYVFILDCCRDPVSGIVPTEPAFTLPSGFAFGPGHPVQSFVVMAADWGRKAFERIIPEAEMKSRLGVLTSHLTTGLSDPAAADAGGCITSETLRSYLIRKMAETEKVTGVAQQPDFIPPSRGEIIFKTIPVGQLPTVQVRITAPAGLTGELVLRDGSFTEMGRHAADQLTDAQPDWTVSLERTRLYIVEHALNGQSTSSLVPLDLRNVPSPYVFSFSDAR